MNMRYINIRAQEGLKKAQRGLLRGNNKDTETRELGWIRVSGYQGIRGSGDGIKNDK